MSDTKEDPVHLGFIFPPAQTAALCQETPKAPVIARHSLRLPLASDVLQKFEARNVKQACKLRVERVESGHLIAFLTLQIDASVFHAVILLNELSAQQWLLETLANRDVCFFFDVNDKDQVAIAFATFSAPSLNFEPTLQEVSARAKLTDEFAEQFLALLNRQAQEVRLHPANPAIPVRDIKVVVFIGIETAAILLEHRMKKRAKASMH